MPLEDYLKFVKKLELQLQEHEIFGNLILNVTSPSVMPSFHTIHLNENAHAGHPSILANFVRKKVREDGFVHVTTENLSTARPRGTIVPERKYDGINVTYHPKKRAVYLLLPCHASIQSSVWKAT